MKDYKNVVPNIFVIFGATGDLNYRKLMPALYNLYIQNLISKDFFVICIGRRDFTEEDYRNKVVGSIKEFSKQTFDEEDCINFCKIFKYVKLDFILDETYEVLKKEIHNLCNIYKCSENIMYYMAVSPEYFSIIVDKLKQNNLEDFNKGLKRIIVEKPFGENLESAKKLNEKITEIFTEKEIYRIDHYLGKEMIQNIMAIRFANPMVESIWNHRYIDNIQITSNESLGVLSRGNYYEKSGALKDMFQNHMLQLLTLIAMEPPTSLNAESIRDEKVKVLKAIPEVTEEFVLNNVVRGQYVEDEKNTLKSYRDEENVSKESNTETFVAVKCFVNNYRWTGVPFYVRTGKRLSKKITEVVIEFKDAPFVLYNKENNLNPNLLVIRINPDERIFLRLNVKKQGNENEIAPIQMDFCQNCHSVISAEAYEKLIYDAIRGDSTLFTSWDETEFSWKFVEQILDIWKNKDVPLYLYDSLTNGPRELGEIFERKDMKWWDL